MLQWFLLTITVPPLIIHGGGADRRLRSRRFPARLERDIEYISRRLPHGLADRHSNEPNTDLLAFRKSFGERIFTRLFDHQENQS